MNENLRLENKLLQLVQRYKGLALLTAAGFFFGIQCDIFNDFLIKSFLHICFSGLSAWGMFSMVVVHYDIQEIAEELKIDCMSTTGFMAIMGLTCAYILWVNYSNSWNFVVRAFLSAIGMILIMRFPVRKYGSSSKEERDENET